MSGFFTNKTVLVPYDFSEPSAAAIDEALGMVGDTGRVFVLHVIVPLTNISLEPGVIVDLASDESRRTAAIELLKERLNDPANKMSTEVRIGDPGSEIVRFAAEINADMIIMPSHGRTGLTRLLLGSVAERVLRLAECPVLVLRHPKKNK